ncbi:MAG: bifunctional diguanylate cyclase/phosphodiesterase [Betaproteobacteria bacterium]
MDESDSPGQTIPRRTLPAMLDALTGLPDRELFLDRLEQALLGATRGGSAFAVLIMEFEPGGDAGGVVWAGDDDQVAVEVARRLTRTARKSDTVARLGARQFAGILFGTTSADGARIVAAKVASALRPPMQIDGRAARIEFSYGIALYPDNGIDSSSLLRNAQRGVDQARRSADGIEVFADAAPVEGVELPPAFLRFKEALANHELLVHYQPKVDLATGAVTGVEALARWQSPRLGLLMPAQFIAAAERTSAISTISFAVLDLALDQAALWSAKGIELPIAVNFSARILGEHAAAERIVHAVEQRGLNPSILVLDLEYGALASGLSAVRAALNELLSAGIRIAIDGFGNTPASLHELRNVDISAIKIDRTFVMGLTRNGRDAAIVRSIAALANGLEAEVIAIGIEQRDTWNTLIALGCGSGQGFDIGHPMSAPALELWLAHWKALAQAVSNSPPEFHYA